jgi:hypothetical protein
MQTLSTKFPNLISHPSSHLLDEMRLDNLAASLASTSNVPLLSEKRYQKLLKTYLHLLTAVALLNEEGELIFNHGFSDETSLSIVAGTLIYSLERINLELNWEGDRIWLASDSVLFRLHQDRYLYLQTQMPFRKRVDEMLDLLKN